MSNTRVLVIDDSAFMRKMISDMINQAEGLEVIDTARNGKIGIEKVHKLKPDVVTLDIEMPVMDGLTALESIMEEYPTPVIMLSSLTQAGADSTIRALELGAIDFISKPSGAISLDIDKVAEDIVQKVASAASSNFTVLPKRKDTVHSQDNLRKLKKSLLYKKSIVAIGVSTGGPRALQMVLRELPKDFPAPIVIAQHMPPRFTKSLADRLDKLSDVKVKEAEHGDVLKPGTVYIAPGGTHLTVDSSKTSLTLSVDDRTPSFMGHKPSVNYLFQSLAEIKNTNKVLLVLTGMGNDGTEGAKKLKSADPSTLIVAESNKSATIFGMPRSIIEHVGADYISSIEQMTETLNEIVNP
ncbi:chemotaxis response regulator protein-glutamate methylesterase [Halalkalibacillus sediminis]|uniref:Protein-glutamate methylesterase/protein-glutamine glutaminase n=1 Tax=Halalkalibacillus sediminis TaxID=2018042 RepID=A0A2I0QWF8_9BACI|nr:chemotaxis response regulator protein-glutamate methylesterase [Halalkalibacillus sediminis]PKR78639.1 chemotaxis response regulator protein-glutamate methylesterase [Halalkalibacillus sediminis]